MLKLVKFFQLDDVRWYSSGLWYDLAPLCSYFVTKGMNFLVGAPKNAELTKRVLRIIQNLFLNPLNMMNHGSQQQLENSCHVWMITKASKAKFHGLHHQRVITRHGEMRR